VTAFERREASTMEKAVSKVDWANEPTPLFADFVFVGAGIDQFAIVFCCTSPEGVPDSDGKVPARVVASLRLSPTNFVQLRGVLNEIQEKWEAQHKEIAEAVRAALAKAK
jgi:hypothetical protein